MRRNELRGMTGGNVSNSSERRLDTCTKRLSRDLFSVCFYYLHVQVFCVCLYLDIYFLTCGASSSDCVKPSAERGGIVFFGLFVSRS
jgi:hypothetical protein